MARSPVAETCPTEAGHQALNAAVRDAINQIVATRTLTNQEVTDEELAEFEESIGDIVSDAVSAQQSVFENIWSWLNADDTIGFKAFVFSHDDLTPNTVTEFSHRWHDEGDWEIFGTVTALDVCPATALNAILPHDPRRADLDRLSTLRAFQDKGFRDHPGLHPWWQVLQRNALALAGALADTTHSRRLRVDALRAADLLQDKHFRQARDVDAVIAALAASPPSRRRPRSPAPE